MFIKTFIHSLVLMFFASCAQEGQELQLNDGHLIGGSRATQDIYRSTVTVNSSCTASKIGAKVFILAAHCVVQDDTDDATLVPGYTKGQSIRLITHYDRSYSLTIRETIPHETYTKGIIEWRANGKETHTSGLYTFDVALILVEEETPAIPVVVVNKNYVSGSQTIIIGGYGCEEAVGKQFDYSQSQYKISKTESVDWKDLKNFQTWRSKKELNELNQYNFLTKGKDFSNKYASLCPGDSGGPAYLHSDKSLVGINSYYYFQADPDVAYLNTHTRISAVYDWIQAGLKKSLVK